MPERKDLPSVGEVLVPDEQGIPTPKPVLLSRRVQWTGELIASSGRLKPPKRPEQIDDSVLDKPEAPFSRAHLPLGTKAARHLG